MSYFNQRPRKKSKAKLIQIGCRDRIGAGLDEINCVGGMHLLVTYFTLGLQSIFNGMQISAPVTPTAEDREENGHDFV